MPGTPQNIGTIKTPLTILVGLWAAIQLAAVVVFNQMQRQTPPHDSSMSLVATGYLINPCLILIFGVIAAIRNWRPLGVAVLILLAVAAISFQQTFWEIMAI